MGRYNGNAPIGYTCHTIDDIIGRMESAKYEAEYIYGNPEEVILNKELSEEIIKLLQEAIEKMEDIRIDNITLRDWGDEEYNRAENLEGEKYNLQKEKEDLLLEIEDLKQEIEDLKYEQQV